MEVGKRYADIVEYCGGGQEARKEFVQTIMGFDEDTLKLVLQAWEVGFKDASNIIADASRSGRIHVFESFPEAHETWL